ncbi:Carbon catabolite repressor protein 4 homolog 5-like protein [Drosera capensis]
MGNRRHGHRTELEPSAAVDELHSPQPRSRSHSRAESARVSHLGIRSILRSKFKPLQACTHRRGRDHARWGRRKEERDVLRRRWVCSKENPCFNFTVDHFEDLDNALQEDGFFGAFKARTGDACDGCAIFWKKERFTLLHEEHLEFRHYGLNNNVAQFCILQIISNQSGSGPSTPYSKESTSCGNLLVGNIHVLFNPKRGDIKLGQIRLLLKKAHDLAEEWGRIPIILAGDFNSLPQSALYHLMSSPKLDVLRHDRGRISGQFGMPLTTFPTQRQGFFSSKAHAYKWNDEELRLATGNEQVTTLHNDLQLCSAYTKISGDLKTRDDLGEPLVTSYHSKFMGTVDYIWYRHTDPCIITSLVIVAFFKQLRLNAVLFRHTAELHPLRVLDTLPVNVLRKMGGLPNKQCGSDHLSLICEFAISDKANDEKVVQRPASIEKRKR